MTKRKKQEATTRQDKPFLGYDSPQGLEAAIKAVEDEHFQVRESLCFAVVCSDLPQKEVIARMRRRPCRRVWPGSWG